MGSAILRGKLVRFGYIELAEKHSNFLPPNEKIKAHEFHYYDSTDNGADCIATKPATGRSYDCVISMIITGLDFRTCIIRQIRILQRAL